MTTVMMLTWTMVNYLERTNLTDLSEENGDDEDVMVAPAVKLEVPDEPTVKTEPTAIKAEQQETPSSKAQVTSSNDDDDDDDYDYGETSSRRRSG